MRLRTSVVMMTLMSAVALPLHAQAAATTSSDSISIPMSVSLDTARASNARVQTSEPVKGAALTGLRAGVHLRETVPVDRPTLAAAASRNLGQARAMMVVGLAGLISGAIIGGDAGTIIMVGGTVVGLIGLYEYLQ